MSEWNPLLLEGKKVLVTGAGGRIGSQIVAVMGREGATVTALDLTQELADRGAGASPGKAIALTADVTSAHDADAAVAMAENELGPLDILVNSHGIFPTVTLLDLTPEKWDDIFAVNVRGNMLMSQAVARRWIKRNSPGSIVNISSGAATSARAGGAAYCGSKAALNMMTKVLAIELGQHNIRVNAVSPGLVLDSMLTRGATEAEPYVRGHARRHPARAHRSSQRDRRDRRVRFIRSVDLDYWRRVRGHRRISGRTDPHASRQQSHDPHR